MRPSSAAGCPSPFPRPSLCDLPPPPTHTSNLLPCCDPYRTRLSTTRELPRRAQHGTEAPDMPRAAGHLAGFKAPPTIHRTCETTACLPNCLKQATTSP